MKAAAQAFEKKAGVKIEVVAGPTGAWLERAKTVGDLIFNGSEVMVSDFVAAMGGQIAEETIAPL
jgi:accessory colonization factor AcfC